MLTVQELMGWDSAGIMCAYAAALPEHFLPAASPPSAARLPPNQAVFDCFGRCELALDGSYAFLDIGEVKSAAFDFEAAIEQMGLRLKVLEWLLGVVAILPLGQVDLKGRLFVAGSTPVSPDSSQQAKAMQDWGFSLYVHQV